MSVHLERGYDSRTTTEKLKDRGLLPAISEKGKPAPLAATKKALGSRAHKLLEQRPQEARVVYRTSRSAHIDFWIAFSEVVIIVRRLIREAWTHYYRWEDRPCRRP